MKHIGIVACSAEGAALCYRTICSASQKCLGGHRHPEISVHTPSFQEYVQHLSNDNWSGVAALMLASAKKLKIAGADFLICPDNTIHQALPEVVPQIDLPWLHIADVVADEAVRRGFRCSGIMGTRWLVNGDVYPSKFRTRNLKYLRATEDERDEMNRIIMDELVHGEFKPKSVDYLCKVTARMKRDGCDSVVLGCTELPLVVTESNSSLPILDSTRLLAWAAVREATGVNAATAL